MPISCCRLTGCSPMTSEVSVLKIGCKSYFSSSERSTIHISYLGRKEGVKGVTKESAIIRAAAMISDRHG